MSPKTFSPCSICGREFGSHSLALHEAKCVQNQKTDTNARPSKIPKSIGSDPKSLQKREINGIRPRTQTIERSSSVDIPRIDEENWKEKRPQTLTLRKPTINIEHPVIEPLDVNETGNLLKSNSGGRKILASIKKVKNAKNIENREKNSLSPCQSCSRNVAPEKFHSHRKLNLDSRENGQKQVLQQITQQIQKVKEIKLDPETKRKEIVPKSPMSTSAKGPRFLMCYICGRPFGSKSLSLHEPHCLERWKRENDQLPRGQRRPPPQKPKGSLTTQDFNDASWQSFQNQLVPCSKCARTFLPDRLAVHERSCRSNGSSNRINNNEVNHEISTERVVQRRNPFVICYICGRPFGKESIKIHEPKCLEKWKIENEKMPKELKRPEPEKPIEVYKDDGTIDLDAMVDAAWQSHLDQLVACTQCGRTFYPDRLIVHSRGCKGKK